MSTTYTMTPGKYVITDACMSYENYYDGCLLPGFEELDRGESVKCGSSVVTSTCSDGAGYVRDMDNEIVGEWGSDAANISVIPAKVVRGDGTVPTHYGTFIEFAEEFEVKVYHDAIVIGDRYRVRY